eukprot:363895-Chlamydomonas_euryale.AAC.3
MCDQQPGSAVDPGLGLLSGALCNDCGLTAENMENITSGKDSVTVVVLLVDACVQIPESSGTGGGWHRTVELRPGSMGRGLLTGRWRCGTDVWGDKGRELFTGRWRCGTDVWGDKGRGLLTGRWRCGTDVSSHVFCLCERS